MHSRNRAVKTKLKQLSVQQKVLTPILTIFTPTPPRALPPPPPPPPPHTHTHTQNPENFDRTHRPHPPKTTKKKYSVLKVTSNKYLQMANTPPSPPPPSPPPLPKVATPPPPHPPHTHTHKIPRILIEPTAHTLPKQKQKNTQFWKWPQTKTRGPWWSYIAHLTKQICIFNVEVSAKFTALGFLYKLYSTNHPHPTPPHPRPCFFTNLDDLNWILKEGHQRNISAKLYWNWSSGLKRFI